jgi:hypothetical protein
MLPKGSAQIMAINNEEDDAPKSNSTVQILISYKKE